MSPRREQIVGVIAARGGSKGIPNKNIRKFNSRPLIDWTIKTALASDLSRVIVSTDSEEIKNVAIAAGAEVPFLRPKNLADDHSPIEEVLKHTINYLVDEEGYEVDGIALLQLTNPFRTVEDINNAMLLFRNTECSSVFSVAEAIANQNPDWMLRKHPDGQVSQLNGDPLKIMKRRRQELQKAYYRDDLVYILSPKSLLESPPWLYGSSPLVCHTDTERVSVDINSELDWEVAELLHQRYFNV